MVPRIRALGERGICGDTPLKINIKKDATEETDKSQDKKETVNEIIGEPKGKDS